MLYFRRLFEAIDDDDDVMREKSMYMYVEKHSYKLLLLIAVIIHRQLMLYAEFQFNCHNSASSVTTYTVHTIVRQINIQKFIIRLALDFRECESESFVFCSFVT